MEAISTPSILDLLIRWDQFRIPELPDCHPIKPSGLEHVWLLNHSDTTFVFGEADAAGFRLKLIKWHNTKYGRSGLYRIVSKYEPLKRFF